MYVTTQPPVGAIEVNGQHLPYGVFALAALWTVTLYGFAGYGVYKFLKK